MSIGHRLGFALLLACLAPSLGAGLVAAASPGGTLHAVVADGQTGDPLIGANLLLLGTDLGGSSDLDGAVTVKDVPPGSYDLRVSFMGYENQMVSGVVIRAGETASVDVALAASSEAFVIEDVVVSAERVLSTGVAVLAQRQQSAVIGDGISADMIARSPDATSSDALKRVTGLSVVDNKFVYIRGVTDRYNATELNGVSVAGTDANVDKKSFAFDLIPAGLIANTVVVKSATPDLPGDFSGGLVQVNTLEFPTHRLARVGLSNSWSDLSTGHDFLRSDGGSTDWRAKDDGGRSLPGGLVGNALARALPNSWAPHQEAAPVNRSVNLSYGDRLRLGGQELGFIGAITYKDEYSVDEVHEAPLYYHPLLDEPFLLYDYRASQYSYSVLWGGLLNLHAKLGERHKLSLKNNYNRAGKDEIELSDGQFESGEFERHETIQWDEREIIVSQLEGEHRFGARADTRVKWSASSARSTAKQPDRRHVAYQKNFAIPDQMKENYRGWSDLDERRTDVKLDLEHPLGDAKLKAGGLLGHRKRDYDAKVFFADFSYYDGSVAYEAIDSIFSAENFTQDEGEAGPEFIFKEEPNYTALYHATHDLTAYYLMVDSPFMLLGESFRFAGGFRVEDSDQRVDSEVANADSTVKSQVDKLDFLPSANLTYLFNERTNLRLGYYVSVNRPEFRELSPVAFFDFHRRQKVFGNPELTRAVVRNFDLRLETFPQPGEVLAISFFSKRLQDAIEERLLPNPERFVRTWFNSAKGTNSGMELEIRKSLGFLTGYLDQSYVSGNYTRVHSAIEYQFEKTDDEGNDIIETRTRPMQGQSPWTVNLGLLFVEPKTNVSISLLFNRIGRRLNAVADDEKQHEYQEPRDLLDLAVSRTFLRRYQVKFTAKNLKNEDEVYTQTLGLPFRTVHRGSSYSLSLGVDL